MFQKIKAWIDAQIKKIQESNDGKYKKTIKTLEKANEGFILAIDGQEADYEELENTYNYTLKELEKKEYNLQNCQDQLDTFQKELEAQGDTFLDRYCQEKKFKQIPNIAYQKKRKFKDKYISVYLNEMITPNSFEVEKFRNKLKLDTCNTIWQVARKVGDAVAKEIKWTDDVNLEPKYKDLYLFANEILVYKQDDCDGHADLCSSLYPEFGKAFGHYQKPGQKRVYHAFNVFSYGGDLWLLDTVGSGAVIMKVDKSNYHINYIITPTKTYELDGSVHFGLISR